MLRCDGHLVNSSIQHEAYMAPNATRAEMLTEIESLRKEQIKALDDSVFIPMTPQQLAQDEERSRRIETLRRKLLEPRK